MNNIVIYGNSVLSQMVYYDSLSRNDFNIVAFAVDKLYLTEAEFLGLPLIAFEKVEEMFPPDEHDMLAVLGGYSDMRQRQVVYDRAKATGYKLRNYISPKAEILPGNEMGDNNIIFSGTYVGMRGVMGNNNIIRQNVYLGHDFQIGNHNFIGAGCNIGGNCLIQNTCYIAMGSTLINHLTIEEETLIGAGSVVIHNTDAYSRNVGNPARIIGYHKEEGIKMDINHG